MSDSFKSHLNLNNLILERFWLRFWLLLVSIWATIFSIFHDTLNIVILQQLLCQTLTCTFQALSFWNQKSIKDSIIFPYVSWTSFFSFLFLVFLTESWIWGPPSKSGGRQHRLQNRPLAPNKANENIGCSILLRVLETSFY